MDPRTRNAVLISVLAILALGISAATLTTTVESGTDGTGGGGGGIQAPTGTPDFDLDDPRGGGELPEIVSQLITALVVLVTLACLIYGLLYRKRAAVLIGLLLGSVVALWLVAQLLATLSSPDGRLGGFGGFSGFIGSGESSGGQLRTFQNLALVVLVVGLAVLAGYLFTGSDRRSSILSGDESESDSPEADDEVTEMGRIAGRAADRIESHDADEALDNQVYEAYREMTEQLDVPTDRSTTPR
jgi:hypothetical protein